MGLAQRFLSSQAHAVPLAKRGVSLGQRWVIDLTGFYRFSQIHFNDTRVILHFFDGAFV
jgi:hypothetical protein